MQKHGKGEANSVSEAQSAQVAMPFCVLAWHPAVIIIIVH